jgi:integrase
MPRKRANTEGSIYRNDRRGRWEAVLVVGRREDGRPIRRTFTGPTRIAVTAKLDEAKAALNAGLAIPDPTVTIADFTAWWRDHVLPGEGLAPATEQWYRDVLDSYVLPAVGTKSLTGRRALTPGDVEAMTGDLSRRHSHRTALGARTTLSKVLQAAVTRGLVARNVARLARRPGDRGVARTVKAHTVAEVPALIDRLEDRWRTAAIVDVTTGLRPGELFALHWPDLRLDGIHPQLSVRHALSHVGGANLKAPKRPRSYRTVPLTPEAVTALRAWRKAQAAERLAAGPLWSPDWPDLVFTNEQGQPLRVDSFRARLQDVDRRAHPHRFRHTYATHLLEAGVPIHHVAELLGDTVATVESTYSHVLRPKVEVVGVARGILAR